MKLLQQDTAFQPISIVLETRAEAEWMWDIVAQYATGGGPASEKAYEMSIKISDFFSKVGKSAARRGAPRSKK